ncbi:MAG: ABC transporter ATP-binding protein [Oscillospiraceae bacterium]|nr:ABC transporter ATP-binding protein [Oscillospiraceae bacterium]
MLKKLLGCVGKYKLPAILSPVFISLEVVMEIFIPLLMSKIIDIGIKGGGGVGYIVKVGGLMVLMSLMSLMFGVLSGKYASIASTGFAKNVRKKMFDKIQDFSFANVDKFSTASLVTRLTTDVTFVQHAFMMVIRMMVRSPVMLVSATVLAVSINAELARVFFVAIPVLAVALVFISTKAFPRFKQMFTRYDNMNSTVQENLVAIRAVKAFVRGEYENDKFETAALELQNSQRRAERVLIMNMPIMQIVMYSCIIAVLWLGGNLISVGGMETGELISFISYITQILMSLMGLSMCFVSIIMSRASVVRICEVLDEDIDIEDNVSSELTVDNGEIEFKNVTFSYSKDKSKCALSDLSFRINSGETVGIIGGTGSGKTSLVSLIPRLYDVCDGSVSVSGHDVREYALSELRNAVAMVLQNNVLFSGTILENLKWGNEEATQEEIEKACSAAAAHDFISSFPDGYNTYLGQGGVNLSGGQKQRVCIARALLKRPKIIILDDSTSAVDTATEKKIRDAFKDELSDATKIIIAQRVTSISDADRIIVLDDGTVNAIGTHDELLENNEIYREVYESQQRVVE